MNDMSDTAQTGNDLTVGSPQPRVTKGDLVSRDAHEKLRNAGLVTESVQMGKTRGGVMFQNMLQVMEFARMMATADIGVPKHFRGNPGLCLRVCVQCDAWGFDPFAVADKAYAVSDRLSYESQLIHAVIERHAPLEGRLRHRFEGEGAERTCTVTGVMIGEREPFEWTSPPIGQIKPKNSPEWVNNPDKQLYYHTSRDWARVYCPDVLLGVYSRDELDNTNFGPSRAREVSTVAERLPGETAGDGFNADNIARTLSPEEADAKTGEIVDGNAGEALVEANTSAKPAKPSKAKKKTEADVPEPPKTVEEYEVHIDGVIEKAADADDLAAMWKSEKKLRDKCMVTGADFDRIKGKVDEKIAALSN